MFAPSCLEERFLSLWNLLGGPSLERKYRFRDKKLWRADFAHVGARVLVEVEGVIWVNDRHNWATGFNVDLEKYLEAGLLGWRIFGSGQIRSPW